MIIGNKKTKSELFTKPEVVAAINVAVEENTGDLDSVTADDVRGVIASVDGREPESITDGEVHQTLIDCFPYLVIEMPIRHE